MCTSCACVRHVYLTYSKWVLGKQQHAEDEKQQTTERYERLRFLLGCVDSNPAQYGQHQEPEKYPVDRYRHSGRDRVSTTTKAHIHTLFH